MTVHQESIQVPLSHFSSLEKKIKRLAKKASRFNNEPVGLEVVGHSVRRVGTDQYTSEGNRVYRDLSCVDVVVSGPAPKLAGWELAARLENVEGGTIIHACPSFSGTIPHEYRDADTSCDHCKTRRFRKEVFLVVNEAGEFKKVGRQCIADFLGHQTPEALAAYASFWSEEVFTGEFDDNWTIKAQDEVYPVEDILALTHCHIKADGWVSRSAASGRDISATADDVARHFSWDLKVRHQASIDYKPTEDDKRVGQETAQWIKEEIAVKTDKSDYEHNLVLATIEGHVSQRHFGLVCSAIQSRLQFVSRLQEYKAQREAEADSKWLGEEKERLEFDVKVTSKKYIDSDFGGSTLFKFITPDGNVISTFHSGSFDAEIGAELKIKGTVKRHSEYKGIKETQVNRVAAA